MLLMMVGLCDSTELFFLEKKDSFVELFPDFNYLFLAFSFFSSFFLLYIFFFILATTSHPPSAVSLKCMQFECSQLTIGIP